MRIAQVCPRYYPFIGGVESHVRAISERLVKQGFEVDVLTTDPDGKLEPEVSINGVTVRRFRSWSPNESYHLSWKLEHFLSENTGSYDVVHAHAYHGFPAFHVSRVADHFFFTPHYHGRGHTLVRDLLHTPYKPIGRRILRKADLIFCVSNYERELLRRNFQLDEKKLVLIGNGIDPEEFRQSTHVQKDVWTILSVSRLEQYKGLDYLIRTLSDELLKDFRLEIVGDGPDGERLVELAASWGFKTGLHSHCAWSDPSSWKNTGRRACSVFSRNMKLQA